MKSAHHATLHRRFFDVFMGVKHPAATPFMSGGKLKLLANHDTRDIHSADDMNAHIAMKKIC